METHVIRANVAAWQVIFNCPASASACIVKVKQQGELLGTFRGFQSGASQLKWYHAKGVLVGM